eukprot:278008_1
MPRKCTRCRRVKCRGHTCPEYFCSHCNRRFARDSNRKAHEETHTTETLTCDICNQPGYNTHDSLRRHKLIHESVECENCGNMFNARTIVNHATNGCGLKRGPPTTSSKLNQQSVNNIINQIENREPQQGKPTAMEIHSLMETEGNNQGIELFKPSQHTHSSKKNIRVVQTFIRDNNIDARGIYDKKYRRIQQTTPVNQLQTIARANASKRSHSIYSTISPHEQYTIQSTCVIKSTSKEQESQKRKGPTGCANKWLNFADRVWKKKKNMIKRRKNQNRKKRKIIKKKIS